LPFEDCVCGDCWLLVNKKISEQTNNF